MEDEEPTISNKILNRQMRHSRFNPLSKLKSFLFFHAKAAILIGLCVLTLMFIIGAGTYIYYFGELASQQSIMNNNNTGVLLLDRTDTPFFSFYSARERKDVALSDIPQVMQQSVIASEDKDFYTNPGYSIKSIVRALLFDVQNGQLAYGGSTITQQLVKNALLSQQKSFLRKYQEVILAAEINRRYSKDQILGMYLNSVYFGEGSFGIENAAQTYFGIDAKDLDLAQSAMLTGILPAPSAWSPISGDYNQAKIHQQEVLQKMVAQGYITQDEASQAAQEQLVFAKPANNNSLNQLAPHFALMVKDWLIAKYGEETISRSGFKVTTTLDANWQSYAENVVKTQVHYLAGDNVSNGAAVVEDPRTGEIRALVGSEDWNNPQFGQVNMAQTPRQPGSSFKPIIYADALSQGLITPETILQDEPTDFNGYKPLDYDKKFRGPVTVRRALSNSLNIPAVEVMQKVGVQNGIDYAQKLGITTLDSSQDYGLSLILGTAEVPLTEMTNVYSTFANQGVKNDLSLVSEITDKNGNVIYSSQPNPDQVVDPRVAFQISSILSDNTARAEEFGNALTISRQAAVKTGTTEDYVDSWTLGYTPSLAVGVWVGNNDHTPMDNIAGSLGAAPIWRSLMTHFLSGTAIEQFTPPAGLVVEQVCRINGLLVNEATSSAVTDYFLPGTEPTDNCMLPTPTPTPTPSPSPTPISQPIPAQTPEIVTPEPVTTPAPTPQPTLIPFNTLPPLPTLPPNG